MVIVSDTSPIVNLAAIGKLNLLPDMFGKVYLPVAVYDEIVVRGAGQPGSSEIQAAPWVEVKQCANPPLLQQIRLELDPGEAEAIVLALELQTQNVLMDEKDGRAVAIRYHLKPIGVLGILLEAKSRGLITSVRQCMDDLKIIARFYIADSLYQHLLMLAGE
jgi:predicted nucleic acid-binding protein